MLKVRLLWCATEDDFVIRLFYSLIQTCVRVDGGKYSEWFPVDQILPQGCVLATLVFNKFFKVAIHVAFTRFEGDEDTWMPW